jgi:predicted DNA-binding protein
MKGETPMIRKISRTFQLPKETVARLDYYVKHCGATRNGVVAAALDIYLPQLPKKGKVPDAAN